MAVIFKGTVGFMHSWRNRDISPMSIYWRWLGWKWAYDLMFVAGAVLNPHLVVAAALLFVLAIVEYATDSAGRFIEAIAKPWIRFDGDYINERIVECVRQYHKNMTAKGRILK